MGGVVRQVRRTARLRMQTDSGANISVTNRMDGLHDFRYIEPVPVNGWSMEASRATCTGFGYFLVWCDDGEELLVPCFYSEHVSETILSPDHFCAMTEEFSTFFLRGDTNRGDGYLRFESPSRLRHATLMTERVDGLWFVSYDTLDLDESNGGQEPDDRWFRCGQAKVPTSPTSQLLAETLACSIRAWR